MRLNGVLQSTMSITISVEFIRLTYRSAFIIAEIAESIAKIIE